MFHKSFPVYTSCSDEHSLWAWKWVSHANTCTLMTAWHNYQFFASVSLCLYSFLDFSFPRSAYLSFPFPGASNGHGAYLCSGHLCSFTQCTVLVPLVQMVCGHIEFGRCDVEICCDEMTIMLCRLL